MSASSTPLSRRQSHVLSEGAVDGHFLSPSTQRKPVQLSSGPLLSSCPSNDDEQERRQRRRSKVINLHMGSLDSSLQDSPARSATGTPAPLPKLSNAQICEHYSTCIKLSTENKITMKNAFGLHLIDYMADILKQKDSELTNFKVAAGTLDASTKIYAVRIDAVHTDAYRVLGGLGSDAKPEEGREAEAGEVDGEDPEADKKAVKKKKKPSNKKTVEQNLSNINSSESERKCEVDPMFQKLASSFDETSTAGVFLPVLFSEDCYSELRFPSDVILLRSQPPPQLPPPTLVPAAPFTAALQLVQEKKSICPSLENFSFTKWSSEDHDQNVSNILEKFKSSEHVFDVNAEPEDEGEPLGCGDDFDADACDDGPEEGEGGNGQQERRDVCASNKTPGRDVIAIGDWDVGTMCLQLSSKPGEYSYFSPRTMSLWAGPGHWRFKPRHKLDHMPDKDAKKRKPKKTFELNFDDDINFEVYFRTTRAATTNSKSALDTTNKKTVLPNDFHYEPELLSQLSSKPSNTLSRLSQKPVSGESAEGVGDYDYNNPNDTSNFCPGVEVKDSDEELGGFSGPEGAFETGFPAESNGLDITTYGEGNLVAEPHKVNKIEINYAKTAKKMDMKRLKTSMWGLLTDCQDTQAEVKESDDASEVNGEKAFSQTTKSLLQR
ncbi:CND2 protein, partial [Amia calva]|nr:CND2 protein [Amia calva]